MEDGLLEANLHRNFDNRYVGIVGVDANRAFEFAGLGWLALDRHDVNAAGLVGQVGRDAVALAVDRHDLERLVSLHDESLVTSSPTLMAPTFTADGLTDSGACMFASISTGTSGLAGSLVSRDSSCLSGPAGASGLSVTWSR